MIPASDQYLLAFRNGRWTIHILVDKRINGMSDNPHLEDYRDRDRINVDHEPKLRYWSEELGITPEILKDAGAEGWGDVSGCPPRSEQRRREVIHQVAGRCKIRTDLPILWSGRFERPSGYRIHL